MKGVKTQGKDPQRSKDPFAEKEGLKNLPKTPAEHTKKGGERGMVVGEPELRAMHVYKSSFQER